MYRISHFIFPFHLFSVPLHFPLHYIASAHGELQLQKMLEISTLKLDYASWVMHLNFGRQWDIILIMSGLNTACYRSVIENLSRKFCSGAFLYRVVYINTHVSIKDFIDRNSEGWFSLVTYCYGLASSVVRKYINIFFKIGDGYVNAAYLY